MTRTTREMASKFFSAMVACALPLLNVENLAEYPLAASTQQQQVRTHFIQHGQICSL